MEAKIATLWPEISLFLTACIVMVVGLSRSASVRAATDYLVYAGLAVAFFLTIRTTPESIPGSVLPGLALYGKMLVAFVGILLYMLQEGVADREYEGSIARGVSVFDPLRSIRGEFAAFFLFSLTGLMLCASADDLIWLFLALELTSLPTYVMVALSTPRERSLEASVKYFFLGALGAAIFLYGFALIYGGTGTTNLAGIREAIYGGGGLNTITLIGMILALLGVCFKIAAVPMHFYTPDVYEGAAGSVAGMLAFVPKSAGFFAIILLTSCIGWHYGSMGGSLPEAIRWTLIIIAVLTMTVGNILALHQRSLKRLLAYSSIAHSGYMLVGIIAGPGEQGAGLGRNGLAAVLFYLASYGIMSVGTFAVAATLERERKASREVGTEEVDDLADLRGLCSTRPLLGWTLVISSMGLLGLPPLLGFVGKLPLFTSAIAAGEVPLVIILGLNSAIAAWYYLGLAKTVLIEKPEALPGERIVEAPYPARKAAGVMAAVLVVVLALVGTRLGEAAARGGRYGEELPRSQRADVEPEATASVIRPVSVVDKTAKELHARW